MTPIYSFVPVTLFCFVSGSFQAIFTKSMYSAPKISSFSVNSLCLCELSIVCLKHAFICLDSSSVVVRVLHFSASSLFYQVNHTIQLLFNCVTPSTGKVLHVSVFYTIIYFYVCVLILFSVHCDINANMNIYYMYIYLLFRTIKSY